MLSKYGRHFDVHPKGWRLFADLLENTASGLEILTPAFPHLFVFIGATAGAGRSAASLIQPDSSDLSDKAKNAAAEIERRLVLGSTLCEVVESREDAVALFDLYKNEAYMLTEHKGNFFVILKENASPQDMLRSLYQVNFLYWLETNAGINSRNVSDDCRPGGKLQISLEYAQTGLELHQFPLVRGCLLLGDRPCPQLP